MPGYSPIAKGADVRELLRRVDVVLSSRLASADFDARLSAARAARIDRIVTLEEHSVGTLTADGTEQDLVNVSGRGKYEGWVDLAAMASGDTVVIKEYVRLKSGVAWRLYATTTYTGAQAEPAIHATRKLSEYGWRVTLQQTAGVYRDYDYDFLKEAGG